MVADTRLAAKVGYEARENASDSNAAESTAQVQSAC
jgi:hypothetical protein